jgi:hypothetical protein
MLQLNVTTPSFSLISGPGANLYVVGLASPLPAGKNSRSMETDFLASNHPVCRQRLDLTVAAVFDRRFLALLAPPTVTDRRYNTTQIF